MLLAFPGRASRKDFVRSGDGALLPSGNGAAQAGIALLDHRPEQRNQSEDHDR
jgi:hypothetical protein